MKQISTTKQAAIDTNVLVYCHTDDEFDKQQTATTLLDLSPVVSTQVLSEYLNVIKRKFPLSKYEVLDVCLGNLEMCRLQFVQFSTMQLAKKLILRYDFQMFDSIVVASAIEAGCDVLYSEDLHSGLLVEKQLKIINPFE